MVGMERFGETAVAAAGVGRERVAETAAEAEAAMDGAELLAFVPRSSTTPDAFSASMALVLLETGEGATMPLEDQQMEEGPVMCSTALAPAPLPLLLPLLLLLLLVRPLGFS